MPISRREFLISTSLAVLATNKLLRAEPTPLYTELDPDCPPDAFDQTMQYLRGMRGNEKPLSAEDKLKNGRAWLAGAEVTDLGEGEKSSWMQLPNSGVLLRVLEPAGRPKGAILAIHGGGWALGTALSDEKRNWQLARLTQAVVVSPDYRLAPEHPFPAGPDDCEATARWLLDNPWKLSDLAITGGSAGSHLAALTLCRLAPQERTRFKRAVLFYGVYNLGRNKVWREGDNADYPDLAPDDMDAFLEWFLPGKSDLERSDALYSPMFANLGRMPQAMFLVGTADLLADDSRRMARRWADAGNRAVLVEYPGGPHGFNGYELDCGKDPEVLMADFIAAGWES
jgi:acetyl esterase/lipase